MVKRYKAPQSMMSADNASGGSGSYKDTDQVYCVVLHVVEAINFVGRDAIDRDRDKIVMNAALNTVDFEVEGTQSSTAETIIFNSNCIWECDMAGIKRIKTDHRPVKVTFYACRGGGAERKTIGTLLLPVRGLPVLSTPGNCNAGQLKMFWHKLICISSEFRSHKPEVLLTLAIIKKSILHTKDFEHLMQFADTKSPPTPPMQSPGHSITSNMLQSQANVYVQSLVQLGLLQVGNNPLVDCDIIEVVLQLKQLKNVSKLVRSLNAGKVPGSVILVFDFVGNVTNIELKLNESDSYVLNDVLGLRFKTSLHSMRLYFQRIFYLPINMYMNGTAIANYRMDFGNLLPPDSFFADNRKYTCNGSFAFNRFGRTDSAREPKPPLMEYSFSVDVKTIFSRQETGTESDPPTSIQSGELAPEAPKFFGDADSQLEDSEVEVALFINEKFKPDVSKSSNELHADSIQEDISRPKSPYNERSSPRKTKPAIHSQRPKETMRAPPMAKAKTPRKTQVPLEEPEVLDDLTSLQLFEREEQRLEMEAELEVKLKRKVTAARNDRSPLRTSKSHDRNSENSDYIESHLNIVYEEHSKTTSLESLPVVRKKVLKKVSRRESCVFADATRAENRAGSAARKTEACQISDGSDDTDVVVMPKKKSVKNIGQRADLETVGQSDVNALPKRKKKSNADMRLHARWVEVNKVHAQALDETEKFLQETCHAELHEVLYEDQLALGVAKPLKAKKKLPKAQVPPNDTESSLVAPDQSQDQEQHFEQEPVRQQKKKKRAPSAQETVELQSSEQYLNTSELSSDRILEQAIKKKKSRLEPALEPGALVEDEGEDPPRRLVKKKVIRKNVSSYQTGPLESTESLDPTETQLVKKKIIVKKKCKVVDAAAAAVEEVGPVKKTAIRRSGNKEQPDCEGDTVFQRIKSWRSQQIHQFEKELDLRELHYKSELERLEKQEANMLKLTKEAEPEDGPATQRTCVDYEAKFDELEQHIAKLKAEMEQQAHLFESRSLELRQENAQLATEKTELKARIATMEQQIGQLRALGTDEGDIKQVLSELRSQNSRYQDMAREKDRYKKQWRRCAKKFHALKVTMYEQSVDRARDQMNVSVIDLKQILTKDAMEFEREYGEFRHGPPSPRIPFSSFSGSGDFSPPSGKRTSVQSP
ncbi:hypothetical protein KR018_005520 [Drosophila ironensis]|nr:hypothetical protein KR018_005520 [Drosophila ironensis]